MVGGGKDCRGTSVRGEGRRRGNGSRSQTDLQAKGGSEGTTLGDGGN